MYEGGFNVTPANATLTFPWAAAYLADQTDPGMEPLITTFLNDLESAGVTGINYFVFVGAPDGYGEWGTMQYLGEPASETPKYDALVNFINSPALGISNLSPFVTAGSTDSFTVTVYNANQTGVDTGFVGTIQLSDSDSRGSLPTSYTFTAADAGVHTFSFRLITAGVQTITVTDSADGLRGAIADDGPTRRSLFVRDRRLPDHRHSRCTE